MPKFISNSFSDRTVPVMVEKTRGDNGWAAGTRVGSVKTFSRGESIVS